MARRDRVGTGIAATLLVVVVFIAATIAALVAVQRGDAERAAPAAPSPRPAAVAVEVARGSAVLVDAVGCSLENQGSGVVTADGVVTNAHVIAGATEVVVTAADGERFPAAVRAFDPVRDLALLAVDGLAVAPLEIAAPEGDTAATALVRAEDQVEVTDVRIERTITIVSADIYGMGEHERRGMELSADIDAGDSGGAVLGVDGRVVGIVFSASRTQLDVAYAVSALEIAAVVEAAGDGIVEPGPCLRP